MSEQIRVSPEVWRTINAQKRPGESFNDALERLIETHPNVELLPPEPENGGC
jgi:predicted CopG family antitoxin